MAHFLIFLLTSSLLLNVVCLFRFVWTGESKLRSFVAKVSLSAFMLAYTFLIVEAVFYFFVAQSDNFAVTLSARRWMEKYWKPQNSLGYRDKEHTEADFAEKKALFVVGDSLMAGMGIQDIENRLSGILQEKLGAKWVVVTLARNGLDTSEEYAALMAYPHRPEAIILSYYVNDIEGAAQNLGYSRPLLVRRPETFRFFVDRFYSLNYVYWQVFRYRNARELSSVYEDYLEKCYRDDQIWKAHTQELMQIVEFARSKHSKLIVLVTPRLTNVSGSRTITLKVSSFLREAHVSVLDMTSRLEGRDVRQMTVNRFDAHPNEKLHREFAELLFPELVETMGTTPQ